MSKNTSSFQASFYGLIGVSALLFGWEIASHVVARYDIFPSATQTCAAALSLFRAGFGLDLFATVMRAVAGWLISMVLGMTIGVLIGSVPTLHAASRPILAFLRCLPAFLLITIPMSIGFGGEFARLSVIALASAWIIADESAESVARIATDKEDILKALNAGWWFRVRKVLFFESLATAFVPSARTSAAICFVIATVVESLAIPRYGVGARLLSLLAVADASGAFGFILLTGFAGVGVSYALDAVSRKLIVW